MLVYVSANSHGWKLIVLCLIVLSNPHHSIINVNTTDMKTTLKRAFKLGLTLFSRFLYVVLNSAEATT